MIDLHTYLNDHLAGSVGALELLDHLIETRKAAETRTFLMELRAEIAADQEELKALLQRMGGEESTIRKAGAWVLEKVGRAKLSGADHELGFMQALETISLGILGKRAMWRTLAAAALSGDGGDARVDYPKLVGRAESQFERVEAKVFEVAETVLGE